MRHKNERVIAIAHDLLRVSSWIVKENQLIGNEKMMSERAFKELI